MTAQQRVIAVVARVVKTAPENVPLDEDLRDRFGLDSFQSLELVAALEKHLDVILPDDHLDAYRTVRDIVALVEGQITQPLPVASSS